jgi:hypothetical protein
MEDKENKKKKKAEYIDDGRTIANMNVEGLKWYVPEKHKRAKNQLTDLKITKAERRAMIIGALQVILPLALAFIGIFLAIFLIIHFWLT